MTTTTPQLLTVEEFSRLPPPPDGSQQELVRGEIVMTPPPGFIHGVVQLRIGSLLLNFVDAQHLGRVTVESGVVTENDPDTVRGPDVAFWSAERLPLDVKPQGYPAVTPDLCVEVLSPRNRRSAMREKCIEYFNSGVRLVWVVDHDSRTVTVYRSADEGRVLHEAATLSGEEVVPGFSCRVAAVFA